ncbi:MAG: hypothetical protein ACOZAL_02055 [Patescibacteria group bacterium]
MSIESKPEEKLIPSKPELRNIYKTLDLLEGYTDWKKDLPEKIKPWENSLELFNNVQKAVLEQVKDKVLSFKEKIPSIAEISEENITDALVNNWFEGVPETKGQRREVLLSVASHVIKHMETSAYQSIINNAEESQLKKLGLDSELRDVVVKTLDACMKSDVLFIRFLAFSNLSPKPPEKATSSHFYLPNDKNPHTLNELFPRENQYIGRKFKEISEMPINWKEISGGENFKEYLRALSDSYQEKKIEKIDECYKKVSELYGKSALSDFPILIVPSEYGWGYTRPPYYDPELRVCLRSPECKREEDNISVNQKTMANYIKEMGYRELSGNLLKKKVKIVNSIGDFGVNLSMKSIAQEGDPVIVIYLGEQIKFYNKMAKDKNFNVQTIIGEQYNREMLFQATVFHEFGHFHKNDDPAFKKMGAGPSRIIDEAKAEQVYRAIVPRMIEKKEIKGTRGQWTAAMLENSLEWLFDSPKDDPYYYAATYTLNKLFEKGIVNFDFKTGAAIIKDVDAFYKINEELSKEVLGLYEDESMNEKKATKWIRESCKPNKIIKKISDFVKKRIR